eukprot:2918489-Pleurochrysis_carterae.AAC.2
MACGGRRAAAIIGSPSRLSLCPWSSAPSRSSFPSPGSPEMLLLAPHPLSAQTERLSFLRLERVLGITSGSKIRLSLFSRI